MGKKAKNKEKKKNAIFKSKYVPVRKKDVMKKAEAKPKGSKKPKKALEQEYRDLALKYQGVEGQAASMLEQIAQLQLASREVKDSLARETGNAEHLRNRLESLETGKELDQEALAALRQQVEQQAGLVREAGSRLEAVERVASQGASLKEQIQYLKAGKSEMESSIGNLVQQGNAVKSAGRELGSRVENLSSSFDAAIQRMQESTGRDQVMEAWMENLNRADSDLSLQMGQQQERIQGLVERSEKLDQAAHEITESYRALQEQVRDLSRSLITANEQLADKGAELQETTQRLDSDYQRLKARHGRLAGSVLVAGLFLLALAAVVYWAKFGALDDRTSIAAQQIEQISEQVEQHERRLIDQEKQISASREMVADRQGPASGDLDARFESINRGYKVMDEIVKDFTQTQHEITAKYVQLGENQVEMGRQLAETRDQLAELAAREEEQKPEAKQQEQKPQPAVGNAQGTGGSAKGSAWLHGLNPSRYTIQIFAAYDAAVVSRVAARADLQEAMAIHKGEFNQKDWYVLLYGEYSSVREARSAIRNLPEDILAGGPWVRKLSSIQRDGDE